MRRLVLDTNVLHQEGLASRNMQQLGRLADASKVVICVPTLVKREFLSKRTLDSFEALVGIQRDLKEIGGRVEHSAAARASVASIESSLFRLRTVIDQHVDTSFRYWAQRHSVQELAFEPNAISAVLDDYFAGTGAFRKPKCRDDIIDAMIGSSVRALINGVDQAYIAVKDGAFKRFLLALSDLRVVDSIAEFLALPEIKADLEALDQAAGWPKTITAQLRAPEFQRELRKLFLSKFADVLDLIYLEDDAIEGSSELSVQPNWGIRLNGITPEAETEISFALASYDSERSFSLGMVVNGRGRLHYAADYGDYYAAGEDSDSLTLESMKSDGACEIREIRQVTVSGYLKLSLSEDMAPGELLDAIKNGDVKLELVVDRGAIV